MKDFPRISERKYHFGLALLLGGMVAMIMVLLQPFDTYSTGFAYKNLKLSGYGVIVSITYLAYVILEIPLSRISKDRWTILSESVGMLILSILLVLPTYFYHHIFLNGEVISVQNFLQFSINFALPFVPVLIPPTIYFRYRWGDIQLVNNKTEDHFLNIKNEKGESLISLESNKFILAEAQQNYAAIFTQDQDSDIKKELIRITLNELEQQIDNGTRVHRSYLVNLDFVRDIKGNKRKSYLVIEGLEFPVPVSPQKYASLKELLQDHP